MTRYEMENIKIRFLKLIVLKSTGRPIDLALRFGISTRTVKRIAREFREAGYRIRFCRNIESYVIVYDHL